MLINIKGIALGVIVSINLIIIFSFIDMRQIMGRRKL
jgi:ABC-type xylose transport system permease subunit